MKNNNLRYLTLKTISHAHAPGLVLHRVKTPLHCQRPAKRIAPLDQATRTIKSDKRNALQFSSVIRYLQ